MTQTLNIVGIGDKDVSLRLKSYIIDYLLAVELDSRVLSETFHSSSRGETSPMVSADDTPNGFMSSGRMHYYIKDYQGNVRQVTDADGTVEQDNHYYPYGMLMGESSNILASARGYKSVSFNPYLYGSKEYLTTASANLLDFSARTYDPAGILFLTQDPKSTKFTPFNTYLYCGDDPINRVDRDGMDWKIEEEETDEGIHIKMTVTGVVYNNSSKSYDLNKVADVIAKQIENAFTIPFGGVKVSMKADIKAITSLDEIDEKDHVFVINDVVRENRPSAIARVNNIGGLGISLSTRLINDALSGKNIRSIPHELGHTGGLYHTNDSLDKDTNLMTQSRYVSKGVDKNDARGLKFEQIKTIMDDYNSGKLNRNIPIKKTSKVRYHWTWPILPYLDKQREPYFP